MTEASTRLACEDQSVTLRQQTRDPAALGPVAGSFSAVLAAVTVTVSIASGVSWSTPIVTLLAYNGLKVSAFPDILLSANLPDGIRGYPYNGTISATGIGGATGAITITVDQLPAGLALGETTTNDGQTYTAAITGTLQ